MRFETDQLRYIKCHGYYAGPEHSFVGNECCRSCLTRRGWELPEGPHSIMLVFSTTPVKGASRCLGYDLKRAGYIAWRRTHPPLTAPTGTLYWWPEVITP